MLQRDCNSAMRWWALASLALALGTAATVLGAPSEARRALVIGNANYQDSPLTNPVNDARDMGRVLKQSGFEVVVLEDANLLTMSRALRDFGDRIAEGGVGLFYFAGHGLQVKGHNYLVPADASIEREDEVAFQALDVNAVLEKMDSARNRSNFVILDACRNNPFARAFRLTSQGLAPMDAPAGTLIAFATAPGSVAGDGAGRNGLYTQHLLDQMAVPGLKVEDVFKRVRAAVRSASSGQQVPWENTSLESDFYFTAPKVAPSKKLSPVIFARASASALGRTASPTLSPGDRWIYRRVDISTGESRSATFEIAAIEGREVRMVNGDRWDTDWALLRDVGERLSFEPRAVRMVWPMFKGAEARLEYRVIGSQRYPDWSVSGTAKVVGLERLTVPAGTFDTFKIETTGVYRQRRENGQSGAGTLRNVSWYSPEVKREVLRDIESTKWDGTEGTHVRMILVDFALR